MRQGRSLISGNKVKTSLILLLLLPIIGLVFYARELRDLFFFYQAMGDQLAIVQARGEQSSALAEACSSCHGLDGTSLNAYYPSLAGLPEKYIAAQLKAFAAGQRKEAKMGPIAMTLSASEISKLANYYSAIAAKTNKYQRSEGDVPPYIKSQLKTCASCHGDELQGNLPAISLAPRLAGQGEKYLLRQLQDFRSGARIDPSGVMNTLVKNMNDKHIAGLALKISRL